MSDNANSQVNTDANGSALICADYSVGSCSLAGGCIAHLDLPLAETWGQSPPRTCPPPHRLDLACSQLFLSVLWLPSSRSNFGAFAPPEPSFGKSHIVRGW